MIVKLIDGFMKIIPLLKYSFLPFDSFLQLTWIDGSGATITSGIKNAKEQLDDGKRFTAKSTLKLKAQREHHNTTITCQAKSMPDKTIKTAEVKIEVNWMRSYFHTFL